MVASTWRDSAAENATTGKLAPSRFRIAAICSGLAMTMTVGESMTSARHQQAARQLLASAFQGLLTEVSGARTEGFLRLHEVFHVSLQLELVVARLRRRGRRRRLVWRNLHAPVILEPRSRWNQPAHRHVFLQATQVIDLTRNRRLGQYARRLLKRRRGNE